MLAGATNTAFGYAAFASLIYVRFHYTIATLIAGTLSIVFSYTVHRRFVFAFRGANRLPRFLVAFAVVYLVCVTIQALLLNSGYTMNSYITGAIAIAACPLISFPLNKYYVFR